MTAECFLDAHGELIYVRGYVAPFDSLSISLDFNGGKPELIRPGAFDDVLHHPSLALNVQLHHMGARGAIGSIFAGTLRIWSDPYGLAYECGPFAINAKNAGAIASIVNGGVRGCSWLATFAKVATETIAGERVQVIHKFQHLSHISPVAGGAYPGAGTWCSHEYPDDLPEHLKPLARHWLDHRPAVRQARAVAPRPQARAVAKRRAPVPVAMVDIYPAGFGLSSAELEECAFQEDVGRRAHKQAQARAEARPRRAT